MLCSNNIWRNNLKDAIISELASISPSMAINPELIHLRLQQFLPTFQTPTHPPYSSMVRQALLKLNEECGSSEEDISRYLEKEFEGLPWAHATFLTHHLEKLCVNGELLRVGNERYMVNLDTSGKGNQVDDLSVVNGVLGAESENRCQVERLSVEEQTEGRRESIKEVREESKIKVNHHLEKLCGNREIACINNESDMVCADDCDLGNKEEMSHRLNISNSDEKEDRALVQVKVVEVVAINSLGGVNGDRAVEFENQYEDEMRSMEVSGQHKVHEQRTEGFEEQNEDRREPLKEVQESQNFSGQIELSHHYEAHGEIDCTNNERSMVCVDEETSHELNISDRDEKEDQTLVQVKEREVEAISGWSGVNGDRAAESENQGEDETHSMEVSGQNKASEQRTEGSEEQNEGRMESLKEVQEECRNFSGQIEVADEVDVAKGKLTMVAQKCWGQKRKRQQKTKRRIKVLKDDIPELKMEYEERPQKMKRGSGVKKSAGEQEQQQKMMRGSGIKRSADEQKRPHRMVRRSGVNKSAGEQERPKKMMHGSGVKISAGEQKLPLKMRLRSGVKKTASEQERPRRGKMIGEQGSSQDPEIDFRAKKPAFPCDGEDVNRWKTSFLKHSVRLSEKQKKEGLKHEEPRKRNLHDRERDLFIVCALPATRSRTNMDPKAHMLLTDSRSASLESSEFGEVLLRQFKPSTCRRPADLRGNVSERFTQSEPKPNGTPKNSEEIEEKQEREFSKPEKLGEYEIKTNEANFGSKEAEESMDQGQQGKRIKVYVRRNANLNILSSDSK